MDNIDAYLDIRRNALEHHFEEFLGTLKSPLMQFMAKTIWKGGKRLRGLTCITVCEGLGGRAEDAFVAAEAVEIAHSISLVKDDIVDQDAARRGEPAFWVTVQHRLPDLLGRRLPEQDAKQMAEIITVILADLVVPHATLMTQQYGLGAVASVVTAWGRLALGQAMDMGLGGDASYEEIIAGKTAALFEVSAELGARAAKRPWHVSLAKNYGRSIGMAFQAADDMEDVIRRLGIPAQGAVEDVSVPLSIRKLLDRLSVSLGEEDIAPSYLKRVEEMAAGWAREAMEYADMFPEAEPREVLRCLPAHAVELMFREFGHFGEEERLAVPEKV